MESTTRIFFAHLPNRFEKLFLVISTEIWSWTRAQSGQNDLKWRNVHYCAAFWSKKKVFLPPCLLIYFMITPQIYLWFVHCTFWIMILWIENLFLSVKAKQSQQPTKQSTNTIKINNIVLVLWQQKSSKFKLHGRLTVRLLKISSERTKLGGPDWIRSKDLKTPNGT